MMMFIGEYDKGKLKFFESLVEAAARDHVLGKYYEKRYEQHGDGWGIVIIDLDSGARYHIYKSLNPIFEERTILRSILKDYESKRIAVLVHARKAATSPKNIESVHPFSYVSDKSTTIFVAHNGLINKDFFAKELNLSEKVIQRLCEGHLFALWLSGLWSNWKEAIKTLIRGGIVKVSPNAFIVELSDGGISSYAISYMNRQRIMRKIKDLAKLEALEEYYRVYYLVREDYILISTSTVPDYIKTINRNEWNSLSLNGEYLQINERMHVFRKKFIL